jgi:hypothetical protein
MAGGSKNRSKSVSIKRSGRAASDEATPSPEAAPVADTPLEASPSTETPPVLTPEEAAKRAAYNYLRSEENQRSADGSNELKVNTTPIPESRPSAPRAPKAKSDFRSKIEIETEQAAQPTKRPFLKRSFLGVPVKLMLVLLIIPLGVAALIWHINNKQLVDISDDSTFTVTFLDPAYDVEKDPKVLKVIGGTLDPSWGEYKQPKVPWYENMFCRGRQKAWFCPDIDRHPYIESYKHYGIKPKKAQGSRHVKTTLKK